MISFSSGEMIRLRRSGPATTRSIASLKSIVPTDFLLFRAARMAASFTRLAISAPVKPGVRRASSSRSIVLSSGLPLMCTARIWRGAPLWGGGGGGRRGGGGRGGPLDVGAVEDALTGEAARAQERGVEDIGPVGGGHHDHVRVRVEAVHLDQDLVQGLLALVVAAARAGAALAADRVDLVDEDDARRVALGLLEEVAHPAGADANEHLHELGAGDAEEGHARLAGDGAAPQHLPPARRADQ